MCPQYIAFSDDAEARGFDASDGETSGRIGQMILAIDVLFVWLWERIHDLLAEHRLETHETEPGASWPAYGPRKVREERRGEGRDEAGKERKVRVNGGGNGTWWKTAGEDWQCDSVRRARDSSCQALLPITFENAHVTTRPPGRRSPPSASPHLATLGASSRRRRFHRAHRADNANIQTTQRTPRTFSVDRP